MPETLGPAGIVVIAQADPSVVTGTVPAVNGVEIVIPAVETTATNFPPFDVTTFPSQLIWLVVTFGALYLLMSRVALPRIATILEERHDRIADDIEEAGKLKAESEAAAQAYEQALASARSKAHGIATETRDKLAAEADAGRKALEAELTAKLTSAEEKIAATKAAAMANVRDIAVDTAGAIVNGLIGTTPAPDAVEKAVDAAVKG